MTKDELISILEEALCYVEGAYEAMFPDESRNEQVADDIERAIQELKKDNPR